MIVPLLSALEIMPSAAKDFHSMRWTAPADDLARAVQDSQLELLVKTATAA
jgi:hypothetical protein